MKTFLNLLGTIWVLPAAILVWVFYILPLWLIWKDLKFIKWHEPFMARFQLANKDLEPWHVRWWKDWYGVGLPCAYIHKDLETLADDEYVAVVCVHEARHCKQWFVFGVLFYPVYLLSSLVQGLRGKHWYKDNHFEVDARRAAGEKD